MSDKSRVKKKIVFVLPQLKTGGGVRVIVELSNILVKEYEIIFVMPNVKSDCGFFIDENIKIVKVGKTSSSIFKKLLNIYKMFSYLKRYHKEDFIITTDPIISPLFTFFRFKKLYRYIQADDYRIFDDLLLLKNRFFLYIYKTLTKISAKDDINYLFNSTFTYERFISLRGESLPKRVVHPAINHEFFNAKKRVFDNGKLNICLIARKHPMKRFSDFIEVWQNIKNTTVVKENISKVFILSHDDLSQFDIKDFERIVPKDDKEIAFYLNKSDIYVFTSQWEGFGLPPLEAMGCGCAVIASDAKGINEYAVDGYNALIYEPCDTKALKERILKLCNDRELLKSLRQNGINSAKEFSWHRSSLVLINYLKEDGL